MDSEDILPVRVFLYYHGSTHLFCFHGLAPVKDQAPIIYPTRLFTCGKYHPKTNIRWLYLAVGTFAMLLQAFSMPGPF